MRSAAVTASARTLSQRLTGWLPARRRSARSPWQSRLQSRQSAVRAAQGIDHALLWVVAALLMSGLVMVYSATVALSESARFASLPSTWFLLRHLLALSVGIVAALIVFSVPLARLQEWVHWLFLLGLALLAIVLIPGVGKEVYGAQRWLSLYVFNLQPSELMKLFVILYTADFIVRKQDSMHHFGKGFLPMVLVVVLIGVLLLLEPDLGAFIVIAAIAMGLLFLGGVNGRLFASLLLIAGSCFALLIWLSPWRRGRIFAYLDPFDASNALDKGYQLSHSLIAFGRGEWFGVGLGASVEKLHYLPEAHTDFLLAVIGEELGMAGVLTVIVLFFWFTRRAFEIGRQSIKLERTFAGLVAKGIGLWIGVQAFINMGVNTGLLPTKGLTLPLMSYGGSGILVNCMAVAILLRVDFENRRLMRGAG